MLLPCILGDLLLKFILWLIIYKCIYSNITNNILLNMHIILSSNVNLLSNRLFLPLTCNFVAWDVTYLMMLGALGSVQMLLG
jgi:hypothetical protein